jgi:hypothetical protein
VAQAPSSVPGILSVERRSNQAIVMVIEAFGAADPMMTPENTPAG